MRVLKYKEALGPVREGNGAVVTLAEGHHTNPRLKAGDIAYTSTVQEVKDGGTFVTRNTRYELEVA